MDGDGEARSDRDRANGQAAGLVLYGSQNPNYFAKTAIQYKNTDLSGQPLNGIWAERVLTVNNTISSRLRRPVSEHREADAADERALAAGVLRRDERDSRSTRSTARRSTRTAPPVPASEFGAAGVTKIGLFAKHDGGGTAATVKFDSFTVEAESCGGQDTSAPRTTHVLDPATPNGDGG